MRKLALLLFLAVLGAGMSCPVTAGAASPALKAAQNCRKALSARGRRYVDTRRKMLLKCADSVMKCELKLEIDGLNPNDCRSRAESSCRRNLNLASADSRLSRAIDSFETKVGEACLSMGLTEMLSTAAGGLWFGDDSNCNASGDIPTLVSCLRDELELEVDGVVGRTIPRAGLILDNAGLGGHYPNLPRPTKVPVEIKAMALDGGDLENPGTLAINAGEAIEFSGDPTTLPCGGGNNGKVTIFVSTEVDPCSDPGALTQQLKAPYTSDSVVFGPFTADYNYCVRLKDGSCTDQETGLIDVP